MRICIFARAMHRHRPHYVPPPGLIARVFAGLGHEVTALTTALPGGEAGQRQDEACTVHYLAGTRPGGEDRRFAAVSAAAFDRLHGAQPFDLVIGRGAAVLGFLRHSRHAGRVPVLLHEGTYPLWLHQLERRLPRLAPGLTPALAVALAPAARAYLYCLRRADLVVCNSPALAGALQRIAWWNPPRTRFIPYGFDLAPFVAARGDGPADPPRLMFVGRLTWDKGALAMVEILARLADRRTVVEAIGPVAPKVRDAILARAGALGVADRFLMPGPDHNRNLPRRLAAGKAFLFPSTHPEGLSKAVMEAMAAGLPVVAYRIPGMDTLVADGETGFLVASNDIAAATEAVNRLLAAPALAARLGAAARDRLARAFAPAEVAAQWEATLQQVVAEFGGR